MQAGILSFPRAVATKPQPPKAKDAAETFTRPFLALLDVDPSAAIALRRMAIDFNDHQRLGAGMRYSDWQRSAKRQQVNRRRQPADRANSFSRDDWTGA